MASMRSIHTLPLSTAGETLKRERAGTTDIYKKLSEARLEIDDPLGGIDDRYILRLRGDSGRPLRLTQTALRQLTGVAGMPMHFLERLPASLGLSTLRACLRWRMEEAHDPVYLLRLKNGNVRRVRAILPGSFLRFDDLDVFGMIRRTVRGRDVRVTNLTVNEDTFSIRLVLPNRLDLGSSTQADVAFPGVDIRASETGVHALDVRRVLWRQVCSNGMTAVTEHLRTFRRKKVGIDKDTFTELMQHGLEEAVQWGNQASDLLGQGQGEYVGDPRAEVERVFREERLGNPNGVPALLVKDVLERRLTLMGVSRFDVVQAFTEVAQKLDLGTRLRWEDAMGGYLGNEDEQLTEPSNN